MPGWAEEAVFYHIYPLGFCGAPFENSSDTKGKGSIKKVISWIPHLKNMGVNAIYFGPVFEAKTHGYDTTDYTRLDKRLGSNEDFMKVCKVLHSEGIKVVVDGIFSHVGRDFFAFKDLQVKGVQSKYKDWFQHVSFNGRSPFGDSFYYEAWEGHFELVKLNLMNEEVRNYLLKAVEGWISEFNIDGIRLDVAYCLDEGFLKELRKCVDHKKKDFWLMGEMIHGDYRKIVRPDMLDSATNYECYKGIYSSHNDKNYFEINHSLNRLFARGGLYEGFHLYNFVDNHDVTRIATILCEKKHIDNVYTLLFTMPGIPSIYYGSEWQIQGSKEKSSDKSLRPCLELEEMQTRDQQVVSLICELSNIRRQYKALIRGSYEQVNVRNEQLLFVRSCEEEKVYVALNLADHPETLRMRGNEEERLTNILGEIEEIEFEGGEYKIAIEPFSSKIIVAREKIKKEMLMKENKKETKKAIKQDKNEREENQQELEQEEKKRSLREKVMKLFSRSKKIDENEGDHSHRQPADNSEE